MGLGDDSGEEKLGALFRDVKYYVVGCISPSVSNIFIIKCESKNSQIVALAEIIVKRDLVRSFCWGCARFSPFFNMAACQNHIRVQDVVLVQRSWKVFGIGTVHRYSAL